mmetsp:Transcript_73125/g.131716  ORF Transcript_73125/g.131716 Transcript_73125/m.131716 type:complete len:156 (+) Transcript_73125:86-553(+)|eukprot:CAMPEP_0115061986 /NCGR_PEP_ID=MMETSP0227-20121206/8303_1 /TAXON_ID=89957 /ORGANISM="Polarella glacialis, Strain CCMP 1383" /LENGTH=155 /DNA_ID=CAMNT_0002447331 /DNA_START=95 /DNA_END=562 /DNA_ORIENTATION=+
MKYQQCLAMAATQAIGRHDNSGLTASAWCIIGAPCVQAVWHQPTKQVLVRLQQTENQAIGEVEHELPPATARGLSMEAATASQRLASETLQIRLRHIGASPETPKCRRAGICNLLSDFLALQFLACLVARWRVAAAPLALLCGRIWQPSAAHRCQ